MEDLLAKAHAQLNHALRLIEQAQALPPDALERAGALSHDADLACLAAADTLSAAFGRFAEHRFSGRRRSGCDPTAD